LDHLCALKQYTTAELSYVLSSPSGIPSHGEAHVSQLLHFTLNGCGGGGTGDGAYDMMAVCCCGAAGGGADGMMAAC
jgi:hypothetical protein